jgi:single-strand DNA-binding protein
MTSINNKVQLIGNLGKDPDFKELESGRKIARFTMATTESYKNETGDKISETTWHNLVAWGGLATVAERFLTKGKEVAVEGRLSYREFEDKEGKNRNYTEIVLNQIHLLRNGGKGILTEEE